MRQRQKDEVGDEKSVRMPRCEQGQPRLDARATTWKWAAKLLDNIAGLALKDGPQSHTMLKAHMHKCRKQAYRLAEDGTSGGAEWARVFRQLGSLQPKEVRHWRTAIAHLQAAAVERAAWAISCCAAERQKSWDTFLEETAIGGAGLMQRLTKERPSKPPLIGALQLADRVDPIRWHTIRGHSG
ncbi:MAG: hypothetical protein ACKPKO_64595, partial [Candidatus Fonsibacter sp.]